MPDLEDPHNGGAPHVGVAVPQAGHHWGHLGKHTMAGFGRRTEGGARGQQGSQRGAGRAGQCGAGEARA
jgi:hypothetical protein